MIGYVSSVIKNGDVGDMNSNVATGLIADGKEIGTLRAGKYQVRMKEGQTKSAT